MNKSSSFAVYGLLLMTLVASGCSSVKIEPTTEAEQINEPLSTSAKREVERLALCQREIEALKSISLEQFEKYQTAFSRLMSGAAKYSQIRTDANFNTQDTLDSYYRYQVTLLCADVSQALLNGLLEREDKQ